MRREADNAIPLLNAEQKTVFDAVINSVQSKAGGIFMIDAPAGSGKTFTMNAISADLRAKGNLVLCSASTGIAALLLPGGLTAHSTFKITFGDNLASGSVCNVKSESQRGQYTLPQEPEPDGLITCSLDGATEFQHLIDFVYPDILTAAPAEFADRGILSPTNASTDEINDHILDLLPNSIHSLISANSIIKINPNDVQEASSVRFLQKIDVPGIPPHQLNLKVGCIVMFIRNVS
ncbi:unnamed protein product, partial [Ectocarpus sp. 12 AP-2014]